MAFNASQFGGGGFMASPNQGSAQKGKGGYENKSQSIRALTIKQLQHAIESSAADELLLDGKPVANITMVGKVLGVYEDQLTVTIQIDDGTGMVPVKYYFNNEAGDYEQQRRAEIQQGVYIRIHGHVSSVAAERHVIAFNIRPVTDYNEVTFHLLQCIFQNSHFTKGTGAMGPGGAVGGADTYAMGGGAAPAAVPAFGAPAGVNPVQAEVMAVFNAPEARDANEGLAVQEVVQRLGGRIPEQQIMQAINFLVDEGHLYSTIDEHHFKACV